jgi:hypothetical protein
MKSLPVDRRTAIRSIAAVALVIKAASVFFMVSSAMAATVPADVARALSPARLQGQSRLVVFGFNIYDAKLWVSNDFSAPNFADESFAIDLRYLRNFSGKAIAERSLKEMRRLGTVSDEQANQWLAKMRQIFPDVNKGDQLIGLHKSDGTASFTLNGKPIGQIRDEEFNRLFFSIWLSPQSSEPRMRNELLGLSAGARR